MDEYISRDEVLEHSEYTGNFNLVVPVRFIKAMKAADVQPMKYSSWEYRTYPIVDGDGVARRRMRGYVCKACGHGEPEAKLFCGGCGARMDGEQND